MLIITLLHKCFLIAQNSHILPVNHSGKAIERFMMDLVRKRGDEIDKAKLAKALGCEVMECSALKGEGIKELAARAAQIAEAKKTVEPKAEFAKNVETAIADIAGKVKSYAGDNSLRWLAIKLFERDDKAHDLVNIPENVRAEIEKIIAEVEKEEDDDAESIITNERYNYGAAPSDCGRPTRAP